MSVVCICVRSLLVFLDYVLAILVVTPLVVFYWRGIWMILDEYVLPESPILSGWVTLICGQLIVFWCHLMQESFDAIGKTGPSAYMIVSRLYTQVLGIAVITQWRGLWLLEDIYMDISLPSALWTLGIGIAGLALAGALSTIPNSPPFVFLPDEEKDYFLSPTRFDTSPSKALWPFFWDCALTVGVFQPFLISAWRGLWTLLDVLQNPENPERSARLSLFSGVLATILLFVAQPLAAMISRNLSHVCRRIFEGVWNLAASYATIALWRGLWMVTDEFLGDNPTGYALAALGSALLLQTLFAANNALTRGVITDGDRADGSEVYFYVDFLPTLLAEKTANSATEKTPKAAKTTMTVVVANDKMPSPVFV